MIMIAFMFKKSTIRSRRSPFLIILNWNGTNDSFITRAIMDDSADVFLD